MAHFYGTLHGNRSLVSRCGTKKCGLAAQVAGWSGSVRVYLYYKDGKDYVRVTKQPWRGVGEFQLIYEGPLEVE